MKFQIQNIMFYGTSLCKLGYKNIVLAAVIIVNLNCYAQNIAVEIKNTLNFNRKEIVVIEAKQFTDKQNSLRIKKEGTKEYLPVQWIDYNSDGKPDEILFQADVPAKSSIKYDLIFDDKIAAPGRKQAAFARFVPERSDDFAWENDKIAFRVYGPKGQEEALKDIQGSTLSSGVDIWLKKVADPVIDKWYGRNLKSPGYYHTDHGEGYDPYHVGNSRGVGGTGILINDSLQVSKNFIGYKVIAKGPLRTVFELDYSFYSDYKIKETKRISLDVGSNFSKFEVSLSADSKIKDYAIGISLHQNKGDVKINRRSGWFSHWESIDDSFVGEGIVIDRKFVKEAFAKVSKVADQSNLLVVTKAKDKITYYAGFAWQKSGQIKSVTDWDMLLEKQALILKNPLKVTLKNNQ